MGTCKPYPSDVSDYELAFVAPGLTLMTENAPQRDYPLREAFNGLRWMPRDGAPWRLMANGTWCMSKPNAGLDIGLRQAASRPSFTTCASFRGWPVSVKPSRRRQSGFYWGFDGRTLQSTPESGSRAGYDGAKRKKGSKVHIAVDALGHLLAVHVIPADEQERAQVAELVA